MANENDGQLPISSVVGLEDELNNINATGVVFSNKKNSANYYLWQDENVLDEDRVGFFVSAYNDEHSIKITKCNVIDIFGVTVDTAGFIGGQDGVPSTICNDCGHIYVNEYLKTHCIYCNSTNIDYIRNSRYGLVTHTGLANVRCELGVAVGDYVISNKDGVATKTDDIRGYKVVAIDTIHDVRYATIMLNVPMDQIYDISKEIDVLEVRMDTTEKNIVSAMNVANEAYNVAQNAEISNNATVGKIDEALGKIDGVLEGIENTNIHVETSLRVSQEAKALAESAALSAQVASDNALKTANETLSQLTGLAKELEPLTKWEDPAGSGTTGASYLAEYMTEGLATKAQIETVETKTEKALSSIAQNGKNIEMLVASIDRYSVGEYSQAYGLTREQATNILNQGMIYIPTRHEATRSHSEKYKYTDENNQTQELIYNFTPGYYYVWGKLLDNSDMWVESTSIAVAFFSEVVQPGNTIQYWYIDSDNPPEGYEAYALYIYNTENAEWEKVNILEGNTSNRITSMIRQTADEVAAEVANARGSYAGLGARLTNTESVVQSTAQWKKNVESDVASIATIKQTADKAGASIAQVVETVGANGEVTAASIVTAVNKAGSSVVIEADHINLEGAVTIGDLDATAQQNLISSSAIYYGLSDSETVEPTDWIEAKDWNKGANVWTTGKYTWQKTVVTKANGKTVETKVCIQGAKGEDGASGVTPTISIDTNGYWVINGVTSTTKAEGETPTIEINDDGYWVINDEPTSVKAEGDIGVGVSEVVNYYMASSRSSGVSAGMAGETEDEKWTTDVQTTNESKLYLWNYEVTRYTNSTSTPTEAIIIGNYSKDGEDGNDGRGIKSVEEFYCIKTQTTCTKPTAETLNTATNYSGTAIADKWYKTTPPTDLTHKYLWNCERITYTDNNSTIFEPALIGTHGEKGEDGKTPVKGVDYFDGSNGKDGTSIVWKGSFDEPPANPQNGWAYYNTKQHASYTYQNGWYQMSVDGVGVSTTTVTYGQSSSASSKPTSWFPTMPTVAEGDYLWVQTVIDYTDASKPDTVTYTYTKQGKDGSDGEQGIAGTSVTITSILYQAGDSATEAPTGNNWNPSVVSVPQGKYLWSKTTFSDGNVAYGVSRQGQDGLEGSSIVWKGELSTRPENGEKNWVYKDAEDKIIYICTGNGHWEPMVLDGSDGSDGAPGTDGLSVFITYNDSTTTPNAPTGNGTTNGWHTDATADVIWMSQKVAPDAHSGTWGIPIKIKGTDGANGKDGEDGKSVTSVIPRYYIATGNEEEDRPNNNASGWIENFDTVLETYWSNKTNNPDTSYYIWSQEKVTYSDGSATYSVATVNSANSVIASWCDETEKTKINGGNIATRTITANQISTDALYSNNYDSGVKDSLVPTDEKHSKLGTFFNLENGAIYAPHFCLDSLGNITATSGSIGGWTIKSTGLYDENNLAGISSDPTLVTTESNSPIRFYAGNVESDDGAPILETKTETITFTPNASGYYKRIWAPDDCKKILSAEVDGDDGWGRVSGINTNVLTYEFTRSLTTPTITLEGDILKISNANNATEWFDILVDNSVMASPLNTDVVQKTTYSVTITYSYTLKTHKSFAVLEDGTLFATKANISGTVKAENGQIGGWTIEQDGLFAQNVGLYTGSNYLIDALDSSPVRFYAGGGLVTATHKDVYIDEFENTVRFCPPDCDKFISAVLSTNEGLMLSGLGTNTLECTYIDSGDIKFDITYTYQKPTNFAVSEDGGLFAQNANITGTINATDGSFKGTIDADKGTIGGLHIDNGIKGYVGNKESFSLTSNGLLINNSLATLQVGNFKTYHNAASGNTYWQTHGPLYIQGMESGAPITSIELMTDKGSTSYISNIYYEMTYTNIEPQYTPYAQPDDVFQFTFYTSSELLHPVSYTIPYKTYTGTSVRTSGSFHITLDTETKQGVVSISEHCGATGISIQLPSGAWSSIMTTNTSRTFFDTCTQIRTNNNIKIRGNLVPVATDQYFIGQSSESRWQGIFAKTGNFHLLYSTSGKVDGSDKNKKNTINSLSNEYNMIFDKLRPVTFKYNDGTSDRLHTGFIAQEVKESILSSGLTTQEFAGYCEWVEENGVDTCGLRYSEFIALNTSQIQKLKARVAELENKIALLTEQGEKGE